MNNQPWTAAQMFQMGIVKIGGDAVKLPETIKKPVENWDSSYNDD